MSITHARALCAYTHARTNTHSPGGLSPYDGPDTFTHRPPSSRQPSPYHEKTSFHPHPVRPPCFETDRVPPPRTGSCVPSRRRGRKVKRKGWFRAAPCAALPVRTGTPTPGGRRATGAPLPAEPAPRTNDGPGEDPEHRTVPRAKTGQSLAATPPFHLHLQGHLRESRQVRISIRGKGGRPSGRSYRSSFLPPTWMCMLIPVSSVSVTSLIER